jgi:Domain of unknown function (DUF4173)
MPRPIAVRILALAVVVGLVAAVSLPGNGIGLNMPFLVAALLAAAVVAAGEPGLRRIDPADAWLAPAALVLAGMTAVRTDPWLVSLDLLASGSLAAAAIATLGGARVTRGTALAVTGAALGTAMAGMIGVVMVAAAAVRRQPPAPKEDGERGDDRAETGPGGDGGAVARRRRNPGPARVAPVLRGLLIASPLVLVFVLLFASADAVFGRLAATLLDWRINLDLGALTGQLVVLGIVAWGAAGLLALGAALLPQLAGDMAAPEPVAWAGGNAPRPLAPGAPPRLGGVEATTVLIVLDALFASFVVLQVAYLFGGRDTLAAAGLTYADYARRGFLELVVAAAIAGSVAVCLDLAVAHRSRLQGGAAIALLALTMVILASALARLRLYQEAYGWTELRFVVVVSIAWLAAAVLATGALLARRRARWSLHVLGALSVVALLAMNLVGPESFVAERNLERAANPSLVAPGGRTGLDTDYLGSLGDEAIPPTVAALPSLALGDRAALEDRLRERATSLDEETAGTGWPSWNLGRERARAALAAWRPGG